jgi:benzoate-CoA ligase family protein
LRASDLPLNYNSVDILERNLPARWDKVALYSDGRDMTFRAVAAEANRVGNALRALDVRHGESVALLALDTPEWVTTFFGTLKVGAVAASFNTLLTPHEYAYMLSDCRARVLVVSEPILPKILEVRSEVPSLEHIIVIGRAADDTVAFADWLASASDQLGAATTHRDDYCCLNYSSGTTGEPKGILHAHKDLPLTAQLWGVNVLGLTEHDRTFAAAKLFFTFGTGGNLIFPWYVGASVVLFAGPPRIPTNVLDVIQKYRPTILFNAPTGYASLLAVEGFPEKYDISSLRLGVSAGESLPAPIWDAWKAATGLDLIDGIGSTENYHIFISNRPGDIRPGSSGKPFPGYELRIVDEDGADVPQGSVGSLLVKGETAALSYLHQYDKSRSTFLGEWLNTGDKYFVDDDGYYWHAGRSDDMLKVGGIWVSPTEVESTLLAHPAVLECAVVGQPDRAGLIKPKAYVVCKDGHVPTDDLADGLIEYCRAQMAEYKRPRWVEFIDELPKTATGKIQRYRLRS